MPRGYTRSQNKQFFSFFTISYFFTTYAIATLLLVERDDKYHKHNLLILSIKYNMWLFGSDLLAFFYITRHHHWLVGIIRLQHTPSLPPVVLLLVSYSILYYFKVLNHLAIPQSQSCFFSLAWGPFCCPSDAHVSDTSTSLSCLLYKYYGRIQKWRLSSAFACSA